MAVLLRNGHIMARAVIPAVVITPPDTTPPTTPGQPTVTGTTTSSVSISWPPSTDTGSGIDHYDVYRGATLAGSATTTTTFTDTGRTANTSYTYKVQAVDGVGNVSGFSPTVTATTDPTVSGGGSWPIQSISGGWGYTINPTSVPGEWQTYADLLWAALSGHKHGVIDPQSGGVPWAGASSGGRGAWEFSRVQLSFETMQPTPGSSYHYGGVDLIVQWMRDHKIRPIILFTFAPYWATIHPEFPNVTVAKRTSAPFAGDWSIQSDAFRGTGVWLDTHVRSFGGGSGVVPDGWYVEKMGGFENSGLPVGTFVIRKSGSVPDPTPGTCTVVFGGTDNWHGGDGDDHLGLADGTGATALRGEGTTNGHLVAARACANVAQTFSTGDPTTEIVIELWNEANGQHGYRPKHDPARYATTVRYIYRAVKEVCPTVPILTTGVSNNATTGVNMDGPEFLATMWDYMISDPDGPGGSTDNWATWQRSTTPLITTGPEAGTTTLRSLLAAGSINDTFWHDLWGWHMYGFGRPDAGGPYYNWQTQPYTAARFVTILNIMQQRDATAGQGGNGLNKMKLICTEMGGPSHQLAKTNIGITAADLGIPPAQFDPTSMRPTASMEEIYAHVVYARRMGTGDFPFPTHSDYASIPVNTSGRLPGDAVAALNFQRLIQVGNNYLGGGMFTFQGIFTSADAPGPPHIPSGTIKQVSGTTRPTLTTGAYTVARIGVGNDLIDAFNVQLPL